MKHTCARVILVLTSAVAALLSAPAPTIAGDTCDDSVRIIDRGPEHSAPGNDGK